MRRILATLAVVVALLFSAGATFADDTSEANKLFVEAVKLVKSVEDIRDPIEKAAALEEALRKFNEIVDDYPSSDLAVKLISGQSVGDISLKGVGREVKSAQGRVERDRERAEKTRIFNTEIEKFHRAAKQGDAEAQYELGNTHYRHHSAKGAIYWYRKAAEQGHVRSQYKLGYMYKTGALYTRQDKTEAAKWYRKAAEQGNARAQFNLGVMYEFGRGVPKNNAEAIKWFRKAAEQGEGDAKKRLENLQAK